MSPRMIIRISGKDYSDFLVEYDLENLTPEEKIREIITCYVILRRNRRKLPQKILNPFLNAFERYTGS
ncbi:hypothetical protein [Candidatus Nitrosotalea bavarica]|uniref:hypothetical protein n=1 Tax=Candidatus Nitrosotalea bavarica TaxID=1903277 RepID=UPI0010553368|nr:hypothetical protein [Candidatus Nitrosotalea bavarica]